MKYFLCIILLGLVLVSCNYDTKMKYVETQCADEWNYDPDINIHKNNIKHYLQTKGIEVGEIQITTIPTVGMTCQACTCPSDRTVYITVSANDKAKALAAGFVEY